ncbi:hypothetical protein [Planctomyces sp. SH-PL62]|uniref:hypothetical protein n=1 Tax=Planctomyces sp. SH-PL62 TaxID=1636152 RepID=UPI00078D012A|nr:hypothetical protein [Planctomyces sp. SH-PL62]AMV40298.1 hypothetical protein VT85_22900 [Planctomyces sp. SH-PL62]
MSWRSVLATAVVLATCTPSYAEEAFFPLMAWNHAPNDPAVLKRMRECGLTVAGFVEPAALDACRDAGLKAIVSDARTAGYDWAKVDPAVARPRVESLIREVKDHPAVFGYLLRDEPSAAVFPGLAVVADAIRELHPGAWPYINLLPNYADPGQLGTPDYESHLKAFVETCHPPILSYDHYALFDGGGLRPSYFANLESMRRAGLEHQIPFWNIILTTSHFNYRESTSADIRFQVYTSLAYGARGIAYFTYFSPAIGNFRMGPIDQFGNETPTWAKLQNVNLQVARLAPTLLKLRSDAVYHFGEVPTGGQAPGEQSLVESIEGPMLVGEFTHEDGSRYVMIVDKSFTESVACRPKFRTPPSKIEQVSPYSGALQSYDGENIWLAPGQGVLLRLTP